MKKITTVSIVDDEADLREHIAGYLSAAGDIRCKSAYATAEEALEHLPGDKPDVILMDLRMPDLNGIEATRRIHRDSPHIGILVVTMFYSIDIRIMGKPNIPMFTYDDLFSIFLGNWSRSLAARIAFVSAIAIICTTVLYCFLKTEMGLALRAVGASQSMARAQGLSTSYYVILGIGIAGALSALGGSILAQNQSFADVNMGFGVWNAIAVMPDREDAAIHVDALFHQNLEGP